MSTVLTLENVISQHAVDQSLSTNDDLIIELPNLPCKFFRNRSACMPESSDYILEVILDQTTFEQWKTFYNLFINDKYSYEARTIHFYLINDHVSSITSELGVVDVKQLIDTQFTASCSFGFKYITYRSQIENKLCTTKTTDFKSCKILTSLL